MALSFDEVADGTVQVVCGSSVGSGFHLFREDIVVTNHHVVEDGGRISVRSEHGASQAANVVAHSSKTEKDFAILQLADSLPGPRTVLQPLGDLPPRGTPVIFAGFPHGETTNDLLVQQAHVAGPYGSIGFYLDGSINGGNSGGPAVDLESGEVRGVVTYRRFFNQDELRQLAATGKELENAGASAKGKVAMFGIDMMAVMRYLGTAAQWFARSIEINSNVGIGMAVGIDWVVNEYNRVGLSN